jgi:hypothetical protein
MGESIPPEPKTLLTDEGASAVAPRASAVQHTAAAAALADQIAGRYHVEQELGRGGLAIVYRVLDDVSGRQLALKQLALDRHHPLFGEQSAAFEREYHTLVQLSHPRIIEVYDFGQDERGRYYTMELLDGGDLKERSPLSWREACALIYDVCSSLALLHSRRLVHRDVTPRNVRSTQDGSAKLIDFGALVPMGPYAQVVGTPQFVAPEVLHRSTLDGRADLFSLGATLYYVLTRQFAYAARRFSQLHEAWTVRPAPPSAIVPGIPRALDALVLSLVSLDPAARPSSAFEVMERLGAIAGLERSEAGSVSQAYLSAPVLVARDEPLAALRTHIDRAVRGDGSSVLLQGEAGVGRSRMLDACVLDAKIAGAIVLRAHAGSQGGDPFAVARVLIEQVVEAVPELAASSARLENVSDMLLRPAASDDAQLAVHAFSTAADRTALQSALSRFLLRIAGTQPLAILIDDVHRADSASLALLATLALSNARQKLLLIATAERGAPAPAAADAFEVLGRESARIELEPLSREDIEALATSLFGDVPNVALVGHRLYQAGRGNPRETIDLVQSLIARRAIRYEGGRWRLPAQLDVAALPSSAAESCRQAVAALSPLARMLGETHALASQPILARSDYALLAPEIAAQQLDDAISELLAQRVLAGDGRVFGISRREWSDALLAGLDPAARRDRHRRLAELYARDDARALERADHMLLAGDEAAGLDLLASKLTSAVGEVRAASQFSRMSAQQAASIFARALASAERLQRRPRELYDIRLGLVALSVGTDEDYYSSVAPAWFAQLAHDSGLSLYASITDAATSGERLMRALTLTAERYSATPERERVCNPEEAIRGLGMYVVISIVAGSRMQDGPLLASLPGVLEPFAPLSPVLHAIWQNAIATCESHCDNRPEDARRRWLEVLEALSSVSVAELVFVERLRNAILYGIGSLEARMGLTSAEQRARLLDDDTLQAVSAMSMRKIARLHQGDFAGAEHFRKAGERLALHADVHSMFSATLQAELIAHALASDLTGIRQVTEKIEPLAARFAGWQPYKHLADGYLEQIRERPEAALAAYERGLVLIGTGRGSAWPRLEAARIEALVLLGREGEARECGERALAACAEHGIAAAAFMIRRAVALAEAKLGDYEGASRRLGAVIADMIAFGVSGLELGAAYEARTRIAIWFSDEAAIVEFARHTAREYRYGEGSSLGARYERLMDEARGAGASALPQLMEFQTKLTTSHLRGASAVSLVAQKLADAGTPQERAQRALQLLCHAQAGRTGHLYLRTARGLQRVASLGEQASDRSLDDFVRSHVAQQLDAADTATTVETGHGLQLTAATNWLDARGAAHHPLLLMADVDGVEQCVGAAVIEAGEGTQLALPGRHLLDAIGEYLLRAGDIDSAASGPG